MPASLHIPPWGDSASWQEANESISCLVNRYSKELMCAKMYAGKIRETLESICSPMDSLCMQTCPWCPEPCCLSAKVWVGFQDLVFLYLMGYASPERQLLGVYTDTCRYLGPKGCMLSRIQRPWICTWYLCPTQKAILRGKNPAGLQFLEQAFDTIKTARVNMENAFIRTVTWAGNEGAVDSWQ